MLLGAELGKDGGDAWRISVEARCGEARLQDERFARIS